MTAAPLTRTARVDAAVEDLEDRAGQYPDSYVCPLDGCLIIANVDQACPVCGVPVRRP